jgi:hypothetical protein
LSPHLLARRKPGFNPLRIDGYKRHVLTDLDTELVPAVGVTAANVAEAAVSEQITADLQAQQRTLGELDIDRAYLSSSLVRRRPGDLRVLCKAFPVRNGPRFAKPAFTMDFDQGLLTCPNSVTVPFVPGGKVQFPAQTCQACPLRVQCTSAPPAPGVAACRSTPTSGCWRSCAPRSRPHTGGPGCASGSRSSTPLPMSAAGG